MFKTIVAGVGLGALLALTPLPALAQTGAQGASVTIPNRATVRSGTHRTRSVHRNTLNRQKARATAEMQRQRRTAPHQ